jgi:hypothetical protein
MLLHTASEVISLLRVWENEAAEYYQRLAVDSNAKDDLTAFAKENRRFVLQVQQAYNNIISDALEGGFAFNIETSDYEFALPPAPPLADTIAKMVDVEEQLERLYTTASQQARALLPDVARAMAVIARKRTARIEKLKTL